jgi:hypothetical protein
MKIEVKPVMCIDLPKDIFCETVRVCNELLFGTPLESEEPCLPASYVRDALEEFFDIGEELDLLDGSDPIIVDALKEMLAELQKPENKKVVYVWMCSTELQNEG